MFMPFLSSICGLDLCLRRLPSFKHALDGLACLQPLRAARSILKRKERALKTQCRFQCGKQRESCNRSIPPSLGCQTPLPMRGARGGFLNGRSTQEVFQAQELNLCWDLVSCTGAVATSRPFPNGCWAFGDLEPGSVKEPSRVAADWPGRARQRLHSKNWGGPDPSLLKGNKENSHFQTHLYTIYIYICMLYIYMLHIYIYIHIWMQRQRQRGTFRPCMEVF